MIRLLTSLLLIMAVLPAEAQVKRELALAAMEEGRFEDALGDWQDLYRAEPNDLYYENLLECHLALKNTGDAEDLIEDHIRKTRSRSGMYRVDQGYVQTLGGDSDKARKTFELIWSDVRKNPATAHQYSERFKKWGLYEQALNTYLLAEEENPNLAFDNQKALLYAELGRLDEMYAAYLDGVARNPNFRHSLQNVIRFSMDREGVIPGGEELKVQLVERIQAGGHMAFNDLLIWVLTQQGEFNQAFIQTRALYRRGAVQPHALINLATQAEGAGQYQAAVRIYDFLIDEGGATPYERDALARRELAVIAQLTEDHAPAEDYQKRISGLHNTVARLRGHDLQPEVMLKLAEIQYLYLAEPDSALVTLEAIIGSNPERTAPSAEARLLKGDILLSQGYPYDAILIYAQVEQAFEAVPLGQEARYRKARVAFYTGNFEWAKSQFDVLKTSTSKFIANDALRMSLLIKDNSGLDTSYFHLEQFARVLLLQAQRKFDAALGELDSLTHVLKYHALADEALFTRAEIVEQQLNFEEAARLYLRVADEHPRDLLADEALYRAGLLYHEELNDPVRAMELYERILTEHSNSIFTEDARKRYRDLRGDLNT